MTVSFGKSGQHRGVERHASRRADWIEPILFIHRLPPYDGPAAGALLEEIVEAADARDVDRHVVEQRRLMDDHPRSCDGAVAGDVAGRAAQDVQDIDAAFERLAACGDEIASGSLKP